MADCVIDPRDRALEENPTLVNATPALVTCKPETWGLVIAHIPCGIGGTRYFAARMPAVHAQPDIDSPISPQY